MRENLFEMGANIDDSWSSDNKEKSQSKEIETKEPSRHKLHFAREKRNGKVVTIVKPFFLDDESLSSLLKSLKKSLATGGTIKDNSLEFQGEVSQKLKVALVALGFGMK